MKEPFSNHINKIMVFCPECHYAALPDLLLPHLEQKHEYSETLAAQYLYDWFKTERDIDRSIDTDMNHQRYAL